MQKELLFTSDGFKLFKIIYDSGDVDLSVVQPKEFHYDHLLCANTGGTSGNDGTVKTKYTNAYIVPTECYLNIDGEAQEYYEELGRSIEFMKKVDQYFQDHDPILN